MPEAYAGQTVTVRDLRGQSGAHGGYYSGDVGVVVDTLGERDLIVDFSPCNGLRRRGYRVRKSELLELMEAPHPAAALFT